MVSPWAFFGSDAQVSILIDRERCCWIEEVLDNIFLPHEADLIKSIPLSLGDCEDKLIWPNNPEGVYSVRLGYRLLMEEEMKDTSTSSYLSPTKREWKGNWSLRIPNKVLKTLIRRAGLDSLPSRANLMKRKILSDDAYPNYNLDQETSHHALWSCPALASSWEVHFAWLIDDSRNCISFLDVIQLCQEKCNLTELFAMTASLIWSCKN